jgi:hypothetical protein
MRKVRKIMKHLREMMRILFRMYSSRGDEVCADAFAREGDLQGD